MVKGNSSKAPLELVTFISWNCKGLNDAVKHGDIISHLRTLETDVGFFQETHLRDQDHRRLRANWIGQVYHSRSRSKVEELPLQSKRQSPLNQLISDPRGRYVIVSGKLYNNLVTLVSIYAPNIDDEVFIKSFFMALPNMDSHKLIMGGDFNLVMDPLLDRSSHKTIYLNQQRQYNIS